MNPQQHISTLAMHLDPPAMHFHPPPMCFHPRHRFRLPTTPQQCILIPTGTPDTCFDHQWPPSPHFNPNWHPRPRNARTIAHMCVSPFVFFFLASETHVQAIIHAFLVFLFIYYSFLPSGCMYNCSYMRFLCFYSFIIYFYPQNTCMSNHTHISL